MTSDEIKAMLLNKYCPPQFATFLEVGSSTGGAAAYADAVSYNLYRSTGHEITGFEIKVSRGDWLNELKQPWKSDTIMQYCDRWWLVAPKGVANIEEIPKAWGFFEVVNGKFFTRKRAPQLEGGKVIDPGFIASLLRRSTEDVVPRKTVWEQREKAKEEARREFTDQIETSKKKLEEYKKNVNEWEKASGLRVFGDYSRSSRELGTVVRFVLEGGAKKLLDYKTSSLLSTA